MMAYDNKDTWIGHRLYKKCFFIKTSTIPVVPKSAVFMEKKKNPTNKYKIWPENTV